MEFAIAPATMDRRKQSDSTAEVTWKMKHCTDRSVVGGPYVGRGGNSGFVLAQDKTISVSVPKSQYCDSAHLGGGAASSSVASASWLSFDRGDGA